LPSLALTLGKVRHGLTGTGHLGEGHDGIVAKYGRLGLNIKVVAIPIRILGPVIAPPDIVSLDFGSYYPPLLPSLPPFPPFNRSFLSGIYKDAEEYEANR